MTQTLDTDNVQIAAIAGVLIAIVIAGLVIGLVALVGDSNIQTFPVPESFLNACVRR